MLHVEVIGAPPEGLSMLGQAEETVFSLGVYSTQDALITSSTGSPFQLSL